MHTLTLKASAPSTLFWWIKASCATFTWFFSSYHSWTVETGLPFHKGICPPIWDQFTEFLKVTWMNFKVVISSVVAISFVYAYCEIYYVLSLLLVFNITELHWTTFNPIAIMLCVSNTIREMLSAFLILKCTDNIQVTWFQSFFCYGFSSAMGWVGWNSFSLQLTFEAKSLLACYLIFDIIRGVNGYLWTLVPVSPISRQ